MTEEEESNTMTTTTTATKETQKSALQDNLEKKGKNAYYFAHAHKATGPAWDGKPEPKLLAKHISHDGHKMSQNSSFDYTKSNINKYSFLDDGSKVKLYIDMENIGEKCTDDDVTLDYTERSFSLVINNYKENEEAQVLCFSKLTAEIETVSYRIKPNKIILTLIKKDSEKEWHTINDKGTPDHELV